MTTDATPPTPDPTDPGPSTPPPEEVNPFDPEYGIEDFEGFFDAPDDGSEGDPEGNPAEGSAGEGGESSTEANAAGDGDGAEGTDGGDPAASAEPSAPATDPATDDPADPAEQGDPAETPPPAAETPPPAPPSTPAADETIEIGGRAYRRADVEGVIDFVESLTPEQLQALVNPQPAQPPAPTATNDPAASTPPPAEDDFPNLEELADPQLAEWVKNRVGGLEEQLAQFQQAERARAEAEAAQQREILLDAVGKARAAVTEQYDLTDSEVDRLVEQADHLGIGALVAQRDGMSDPVRSFTTALETTYWVTPEFRDREVARQVATHLPTRADQEREARKELNQSLVGRGAATPRQTAPSVPQNDEERHAAMVAEIAESINQQ